MDCPICLDNFEISEMVTIHSIENIKHQICKVCYPKWRESTTAHSCPICRHPTGFTNIVYKTIGVAQLKYFYPVEFLSCITNILPFTYQYKTEQLNDFRTQLDVWLDVWVSGNITRENLLLLGFEEEFLQDFNEFSNKAISRDITFGVNMERHVNTMHSHYERWLDV